MIEGVVDVLKTGFDNKTIGVVLAGSVLTDSVGKLIVGGGFFAGGDVEVAPVNDVGRGFEVLGLDKSGGENNK